MANIPFRITGKNSPKRSFSFPKRKRLLSFYAEMQVFMNSLEFSKNNTEFSKDSKVHANFNVLYQAFNSLKS